MVNLCTIFIDDFFGFGSLFRNISQLNYRPNNRSNYGVFCPTWSEAARLEVTNEQEIQYAREHDRSSSLFPSGSIPLARDRQPEKRQVCLRLRYVASPDHVASAQFPSS